MYRRDFTHSLLTTVASFALIDSLFANQVFRNNIKPIANHWAIRLNEFCGDLKTQSITPNQWQQKISELYNEIPLEEILKFIDFEKLKKNFEFPDLGVNTKLVPFPKLTGLPDNTIFVKKIFGMKRDRAIIPHGHINMSSAHLVIKGEMHLRQYEKIDQQSQNLIIKPTIDKIDKVGTHSSISDQKDNVHWFIANTETAFTFDVIMLDIANRPYDIYNLDIYEKKDLKNGTLKVPILDVATALKKYGKDHH